MKEINIDRHNKYYEYSNKSRLECENELNELKGELVRPLDEMVETYNYLHGLFKMIFSILIGVALITLLILL